LSAGASPQTPLGELTALPQNPWVYLGGLLLKEGDWERREEGKMRGGEAGREFVLCPRKK